MPDKDDIWQISYEAAEEYKAHTELLIDYVDNFLVDHPYFHTLTGNNPWEMITGSHRNHVMFMRNVLLTGDSELLTNTLPWVYHTYHSRGFSYEYFQALTAGIMKGVSKYLSSDHAREINRIYQWMLDRHIEVIRLSENTIVENNSVSKEMIELQNVFLKEILNGNQKKSLEIAKGIVNKPEDIENLYLNLLHPVLYKVGELWENNEISVAHEHLAAGMVSRIMSSVYNEIELDMEQKGKAVITSAPNEYHEIGAWMLSDLLEISGWKVFYLGANMASDDFPELLKEVKPDIICISVSMPFNIERVIELVKNIKCEDELKEVLIMVGGRAFSLSHDLWKSTGADRFAESARQAISIANEFWAKKGKQ